MSCTFLPEVLKDLAKPNQGHGKSWNFRLKKNAFKKSSKGDGALMFLLSFCCEKNIKNSLGTWGSLRFQSHVSSIDTRFICALESGNLNEQSWKLQLWSSAIVLWAQLPLHVYSMLLSRCQEWTKSNKELNTVRLFIPREIEMLCTRKCMMCSLCGNMPFGAQSPTCAAATVRCRVVFASLEAQINSGWSSCNSSSCVVNSGAPKSLNDHLASKNHQLTSQRSELATSRNVSVQLSCGHMTTEAGAHVQPLTCWDHLCSCWKTKWNWVFTV